MALARREDSLSGGRPSKLRKLAIERQALTEAIDDFKVIMNEQKRQADTEKLSQ